LEIGHSRRAIPLLGAHFSIAKGLHNAFGHAADYGCNTLQVFTKNANTWKERVLSEDEIERFRRRRIETGIGSIFSHTSYLINPAAPDKEKRDMSGFALKQELIRCTRLLIPFVVLHPGFHMGKGERAGIARAAESINRLFDGLPVETPRLLLESTAGQGSGIGHTFEQLAGIMMRIERKDRIGICLDTCHLFAAGYDIRTKAAYDETFDRFDSTIGGRHLYLLHLNDSKRELGSRVDRHSHIGKGNIGLEAFRFIMNDKRLLYVPKIIETEKKEDELDWDRINLECLKNLID
jgi:deoxyribonuclease-4